MNKQKVYLFLFEGFSDWEPSYLSVEINKSETHELITVSPSKNPIRSAGGLTIIPEITIEEVDVHNAELLIIPGGNAWEEKKYREAIPFIQRFIERNRKIAAICSGTLLLADAGVLDNISHTSNALFYLKQFSSGYNGEKHYTESPAITDGNIITASGVYPIEFAKEIFQTLKLMDENSIEKWFELYKNGNWIE